MHILRNFFKTTFLLWLLTSFIFEKLSAQDKQLRASLDSINAEADMLYMYEKAIWNASDLLLADNNAITYDNYVVYHEQDSVIATFIQQKDHCAARFYFLRRNLHKPVKVEKAAGGIKLSLRGIEKEYAEIKNKMLDQLNDPKFELKLYEGFNPNFVLLKSDNSYRLYMIMGTAKKDVIPLGNDHLFIADYTGKINSHSKLHSRLLPVETKGAEGNRILSVMHNHLPTTPLITATDICTFRLYGELCGLSSMLVLCDQTVFHYNRETNIISVQEK